MFQPWGVTLLSRGFRLGPLCEFPEPGGGGRAIFGNPDQRDRGVHRITALRGGQAADVLGGALAEFLADERTLIPRLYSKTVRPGSGTPKWSAKRWEL